MALSNNQALALVSVFALLSTFAVEAHLAPSPSPAATPSSSSSSSFKITPKSQSSESVSTSDLITELVSVDQVAAEELDIPFDVKAQMTKFVEGNMQVTLKKMDDFSRSLKKRLNNPKTNSETKECIKQCNEVYDNAKDDIEISLKDIKAGDLYKANFDISAITTNVDTCEQCFEEMVGEDPELKKFDDWVRGVTDDCLGALSKASS